MNCKQYARIKLLRFDMRLDLLLQLIDIEYGELRSSAQFVIARERATALIVYPDVQVYGLAQNLSLFRKKVSSSQHLILGSLVVCSSA